MSDRPYADNYEHLHAELQRLDLLIRLRTLTLALQSRIAPEGQTSRAVYIAPSEVEWLLTQRAEPVACDTAVADARSALGRLSEEIAARVDQSLQGGVPLALPALGRLFGLSPFELQALIICLAPELRRKYDRLYAYLQDDITRKRPSIDLVLELLCETEAERWNAHRLFADTAPLLYAGLLEKVDDPHSPSGSSGLALFLKLDPRVCQFLLGVNAIDGRLAPLAQLSRPAASSSVVDAAIQASVLTLAERHLSPGKSDRRKLVLYLHGPHGAGKRELALNTCRRLGCSLLCIDAELLLARGADGHKLLRLAFRECLLQRACVYLERSDALLQDTALPLLKTLDIVIAEYGWLVFLAGATPWTSQEPFEGCSFQQIAVPVAEVPLRAAAWERCLEGRTPEAAMWAGQLAAQFRLTYGQIRAAAELATNLCVMCGRSGELELADLTAACRQQSKHRLGELAVKIEPHYGWDDLVLPEDKIAHLREISSQVRDRYQVFRTWGFGAKLSHGKGLSALFTGPPGTGKTMAAEVLAHDLELDLYKVDLSGVVSKYIGETEKNLNRIFQEAETSNAILFFDEADALFGKRTEVSDAHDRYANIETSYLLQKMEAYEGIVILTTNLRENMDDAFTRRIRFIVEFPFPDEASRLRIWKTHFPVQAPVSPEIDYECLARELELAGGSIKNIVLNAAFVAAADGGTIGMRHILHGTRREYEKVGRLWHDMPAGWRVTSQ